MRLHLPADLSVVLLVQIALADYQPVYLVAALVESQAGLVIGGPPEELQGWPVEQAEQEAEQLAEPVELPDNLPALEQGLPPDMPVDLIPDLAGLPDLADFVEAVS